MSIKRITRTAAMAGAAVSAAALLALVPLAGVASAASGPPVTLSPAPVGSPIGNIPDQTTLTISIGANSTFTPGAKVNILECADPGGSTANLPTDLSSCDGNTIQGDTVLVQSDGSISYSNYTLYQLPSPILGEPPSNFPVCDSTDACVLYIGQDQTDFTQPKTFSSPFYVAPYPQTITFTSTPPSPALVDGTYNVAATGGGSGNPVVFSSATASVCTVSGSAVSLVGAGTCTINADQAGNSAYSAAPTATQSFTVGKIGTHLVAIPVTATENVLNWSATFSAKLTSSLTGAPIAGQTVSFTTSGLLSSLLGSESCSAVTNSTGLATCTVTGLLLEPVDGGSSYSASYGGSAVYLPSSATGSLNS